jgi:prolipoprotein diacylglyceryltransferase
MISGNSPAVSHPSWIDRLNPSVVRFDSGFGIRWYGLAYRAGFLLTGWILLRWARKGSLPIKEEEVPRFVLYSALGVMIGGRLGYCLLDQAHNILHLSQLYAAGIKGFLVFLVVQWIYSRSSRVGLTKAAVCIAYGNWTIH